MVGANGQLKSVGCILSLDVLEIQRQAGIVDDHVQLFSSRMELINELTHGLQGR